MVLRILNSNKPPYVVCYPPLASPPGQVNEALHWDWPVNRKLASLRHQQIPTQDRATALSAETEHGFIGNFQGLSPLVRVYQPITKYFYPSVNFTSKARIEPKACTLIMI